jgi:LPS O-antigen subunit length determinant protein (WzzB/FepE family)
MAKPKQELDISVVFQVLTEATEKLNDINEFKNKLELNATDMQAIGNAINGLKKQIKATVEIEKRLAEKIGIICKNEENIRKLEEVNKSMWDVLSNTLNDSVKIELKESISDTWSKIDTIDDRVLQLGRDVTQANMTINNILTNLGELSNIKNHGCNNRQLIISRVDNLEKISESTNTFWANAKIAILSGLIAGLVVIIVEVIKIIGHK